MNEINPLDYRTVQQFTHKSEKRTTSASTMLAEHVQKCSGYAAWSGGKDSTVVAHLIATRFPEVPLVWFHSGFEFPETEEYMRSLADIWKLPLTVIYAEPDALTLMEQSGTWNHDAPFNPNVPDFHETLIKRPSEAAHARFGPGEALGLRAEESSGRRALLASNRGAYERKDGTIVCAPLWNWTAVDIEKYYAHNNIPENPVYLKMEKLGVPKDERRAGLVLDGNNLVRSGRATWIRLGWPQLWAELRDRLPRVTEWR